VQWIILIGDKDLDLGKIKAIKHFDSIQSYDVHEHRYYVDYGDDHIFYDFVPDLINDYEKSELAIIPFSELHFIMMVYTSEQRMRRVLQQDNFLDDVYVDNGYGLIVPIGEFIELGMPVEPDCDE